MRIRTISGSLAALAAVAVAAGAAPPGRDAPPAAQAATPARVTFGEYFYKPRKVTIRAGGSVRFVNVGKIEHTVADSTRSGTIRSKLIHPRPLAHGQSQTVTFRRRGTVHYLCTFHPGLMRGTIVVR